MRGAVVRYARLLHIPEIRVARDGAAAKPAIFNRPEQSLLSSPGFTRAFTKYRMASLHCRGIVDL